MKRGIRWAVASVCLIVAVCMGMAGMIAWKKGTAGGVGITIASTDTGITIAQAENIRKEEIEKENPIHFTAWSEKTAESVMDGDGLRMADTTILRLCGTSEYVVPYGRILPDGK